MADLQPIQHSQSLEIIAKPELPPAVQGLIDRAKAVAEDFTIESGDDYNAAYMFREKLAENMRIIEQLLAPGIKQLHEAHRTATGYRKSILTPLEDADRLVEQKRLEYDREQRRIAAAEEERLRLQAKEELVEDAQRQAEVLETAGESEAAIAVVEQAKAAPPPPVQVAPETPKTKGAVRRQNWKWKFTNQNLVKDEFYSVDEKRISDAVRSNGKMAETIVGGIEVWDEQRESVRLR